MGDDTDLLNALEDAFEAVKEYKAKIEFFKKFKGVVLEQDTSKVQWEVLDYQEEEFDSAWSFTKEKITHSYLLCRSLNSGMKKKISVKNQSYKIVSIPKAVEVLYGKI